MDRTRIVTVCVNGRIRARVTVPATASGSEAAAIAREDPTVAAAITSEVVRVVHSGGGRIINFVAP